MKFLRRGFQPTPNNIINDLIFVVFEEIRQVVMINIIVDLRVVIGVLMGVGVRVVVGVVIIVVIVWSMNISVWWIC